MFVIHSMGALTNRGRESKTLEQARKNIYCMYINIKVDWCEFGTFLPSENIFSEASNDSRHGIQIMLANKL